MITRARLLELLAYDPASGLFTRLTNAGGRRAGEIAGTPHSHGYTKISVDGTVYLAHRLAWLYAHGSWPSGDIDHKNGLVTDNRLANLRDVPHSVNLENQRRATARNKTSGLLGVSWAANRQGWRADISLANRTKYLGTFATPELAHESYLSAKRELHEGNTL
jgi:hypothetical protein